MCTSWSGHVQAPRHMQPLQHLRSHTSYGILCYVSGARQTQSRYTPRRSWRCHPGSSLAVVAAWCGTPEHPGRKGHTHTQQYMPIVTIWLWGVANGWMDGWMDRWLGEYCFKDVKGYLSPNNDENEGVDTPTYVSTTCVSTTTTYVCGRTHNACTKLSLLSNRRRLCYIKPGVTRGCQQQMHTCVRTYMYQLSVLVAYACIFACVA